MSLFVKERSFYKTFFTLTFIIALQNLIAFSVNLTDSLMLGAYSELALSGSAICNQIQFLLQMTLGGIVAGMVVISTQYWGKRQIEPIKKIFAIAFWAAVCISVAITAISLIAPQQVLSLLTNEPTVINEGAKFLRIICLTYCLFAVTTVILGVLRSVETVKIGFWVSLSTFFINIVLNYVFIYGKFGMPRMGIRGSALSTLIARIVELVIVLCYVKFFDKKLSLRIKNVMRIEKSYIKDYIKTGLPTVLSSTSWGIAMGVQGAILGRLGAATIAASSIATTLFQMASIVSYGSASASNVVIGKSIGQGDMKRVRSYTKTLQILFILIGVGTSFALFTGKIFIIDFYNISSETKKLAGDFILVLCVTVIGTSYQMASLTGIVAGGGDTKFVLFNDIVFQWCIVLPAAGLSAFVFKLPVFFTFACLKSDQILKCAVAVVKVNRYTWIRTLTREE
ncbi:MAG: MATE family efflux transporter [Eubacteriales bacterium]